MNVCIFGAGGVGGYFGGRLAQSGLDVTFIARGAHLDAIKNHGLNVKSINGDFTVPRAKATDQPETVGTVDLVLCCVKSWQVTEAARQMRPMVGPETVVIPLLNGVEAHDVLANALGADHVMPGLCKLITMLDGPGHIRHAGADPYLAFGDIDGGLSERGKHVARLFSAAKGMTVHLSPNIISQLWRKFMLIAPWSGMGALTRSPIGVIRSIPETRTMLMDSIHEVYDVARANGIDIEAQAAQDTLEFIDSLPPEGTASMQRDIVSGRPSELHEQCGAVVRYGEKVNVPVPVSTFTYHSLLPLERAARSELPNSGK
jgi:2-dehydropantoate 2-reductase